MNAESYEYKKLRLTRIVATLGPASDSDQVIAELIKAGVDIFRINFSHGSQQQHGTTIARIREVVSRLNKQVAILQDLGGPKLRIGELAEDHIHLHPGHNIRFEGGPGKGTEETIYFPMDEDWYTQVEPGERIVLGDGIIHLMIQSKDSSGLNCSVISGGTLRSRAGLNFPDSNLHLGAMQPKDWDDLEYGLQQGVDAVALSFVQGPEDVIEVRKKMQQHTRKPLVIAKIERPSAVERIDSILKEADGIMVARGDLGISVPLQKVPTIQKQLILKARERRKIVITATQMLESMVSSPMPTRAEVTDVANAVFDGTDAVMLSGETAVGFDPPHVVRTMAEILVEAEAHAQFKILPKIDHDVASAISQAVPLVVSEVGAKVVLAPLTSGSTAARISRQRIGVPILAGVVSDSDARRIKFFHAVFPVGIESKHSLLGNLKRVLDTAVEWGLVTTGDYTVVTGGFPIDKPGITNFIRIVKVGEEL